MGEVRATAQNELTKTIAERLRGVSDAYVRVDAQAHSALLAKEYRAVHPDGTVHIRQTQCSGSVAERRRPVEMPLLPGDEAEVLRPAWSERRHGTPRTCRGIELALPHF